MKTELMNIPGKGICIVISDINPNDFVHGDRHVNYGGAIFSDLNVIADCLRMGKKIAAIKEVRAQTGWGLKEAKEYIDIYTGVGFGDSDYHKNRWAEKFIKDHNFLENDEFRI